MANDGASTLATVRQVLLAEPASHSARLLLFELETERGRLSEAEPIIVTLLHEEPEHAPYYGRYGELMIRAMKLDKALALAEEGLKYAPDDAGCLAAQALCDFIGERSGTPSHSLQQLSSAIRNRSGRCF